MRSVLHLNAHDKRPEFLKVCLFNPDWWNKSPHECRRKLRLELWSAKAEVGASSLIAHFSYSADFKLKWDQARGVSTTKWQAESLWRSKFYKPSHESRATASRASRSE